MEHTAPIVVPASQAANSARSAGKNCKGDCMSQLLHAFSGQIKNVLGQLNLQRCKCEACFQTAVVDSVAGVREIPQSKRNRKVGFFGFRPKCSDLMYEQDGSRNRLLIECKLIRKDNVYDIRNGLLQLIEYMKLDEQDDRDKSGCLLVLDKRNEATSFKNKLNMWLINNLAHLYRNFALVHIRRKAYSWTCEVIEPAFEETNR